MVNGWLVFLALLNAYLVVLVLLNRSGRLGPDRSLSLFGPLLMFRTELGKRLIDRVARWRSLWAVLGDAGVVASFAAAGLLMVVLVWQATFVVANASRLAGNAPGVRDVLALPVVNPVIPLGYGVLGLVTALVIHEFSHGVLARVGDMKVKSLGLLFFIFPVGAFVEPDEEDMRKASLRKQNRVFAAGPMSNMMLALILGILFSPVLMGSVAVANGGEGVGVGSVTEGYAAHAAGVPPGAIITAIDGQPVRVYEDFNATMSRSLPGERMTLTLFHRGDTSDVEVVLSSKYDYFAEVAPRENDDAFRRQGFLGIGPVPLDELERIRTVMESPFSSGLPSFAFYMALPFYGLQPLEGPVQAFFEPTGAFAEMPTTAFWILTNGAYWVFWLNLLVGTFNALPLAFLDGGQMFRANLHAVASRTVGLRRDDVALERDEADHVVLRGRSPDAQARLDRADLFTRRVTLSITLVLLVLVLAPILAPRILA